MQLHCDSAISEESVHSILKSRTSHLHHEVDSHDGLTRLFSADCTESDYISFLKILCSWYVQIEETMCDQLALKTALPHYQHKFPLLLQDLESLNDATWERPLTLVNTQSNTPPLQSRLYQLGRLYVIEGATMGGSILAPRISRTLNRADVTSYFNCYGLQKRDFFSTTMTFITRMINTVHNEHSINLVISGAQDAFNLLLKLLNK